MPNRTCVSQDRSYEAVVYVQKVLWYYGIALQKSKSIQAFASFTAYANDMGRPLVLSYMLQKKEHICHGRGLFNIIASKSQLPPSLRASL